MDSLEVSAIIYNIAELCYAIYTWRGSPPDRINMLLPRKMRWGRYGWRVDKFFVVSAAWPLVMIYRWLLRDNNPTLHEHVGNRVEPTIGLPQAATRDGVITEIERLGQLKGSGVLSQGEFDIMKAETISRIKRI